MELLSMMLQIDNYSTTLTAVVYSTLDLTRYSLSVFLLSVRLFVPAAVIHSIAKCGATFQSCRSIATYYHVVWTNRVVPRIYERQRFFPRGCPLFRTRHVQTRALAYRLRRLQAFYRSPPVIILFFYPANIT